MSLWLAARIVFFGGLAWLIVGYVVLVNASGDHRDRLRAECERHAVVGVARVRVSSHDVAYARRQGWPVVLRVGGYPLRGDVVSYDGGREAVRVLRATDRFCRGQDYRLVVRAS